MSSARRLLVLFVVSVALLAQASVALAAQVAWKGIDVTLQSDQQQSLLLVSGELPPDTELPFEAELAVPAGMELQWIGEVLGGAPDADPELKYMKSTAGGMDVYRFTLTKSRLAQIEGTVASMTSFDGKNYNSALKWTAWADVPEVRINQRVPQAAQITVTSPDAELQPGDSGYSYYTKTLTAMKAGDVADLTFSYTLPAAGAATGAAAPSGSNAPVIVILVIFAGIVALVAYNVNRKMATKKAAEQDVPAPKRRAAPSAGSEAFEATDDADAVIVPSEAPLGGNKKARPLIPMLLVIGALLVGFAIAGSKGTSSAVVDGKITRSFGSTTACQVSFIPVIPNEGVDLTEQGDKVVAAFEGMDSIGNVILDVEKSTIEVNWCESSQSDESVRQALNATGLVTLGQTQGAPTSTPTASVGATPPAQ